MTAHPISTVAALESRLIDLDTSGPRLQDPLIDAAWAYQYTCEALKSHHPFHVNALRRELKAVRERLQAVCEQVGREARQDSNLEIPGIATTIAREALRLVLGRPVPIVIRGFASDSVPVKTWTPRFFADNYGSYELPLAKGKTQDAKGTIAQVVADIESGTARGHYVHNVANFFNEHMDLEAQLPIAELMAMVEPAQHFGCQLFMGGPKTGTSWHHASGWNFFFNIHGNKRWFMSHPGTSPWMYGRMHPSGSVGLCDIDHNKSAAEQSATYPLYKYVPVYQVLLSPGDVLVVPPWWWHAITNESPATVAVSTRWLSPVAADTKPAFRLAQGLMPSFQEFEREAMQLEDKFRIRDKYVRDTYDNAGFKNDVE